MVDLPLKVQIEDVLFAIVCWKIWKYRCIVTFNPDCVEHEDLVAQNIRIKNEMVAGETVVAVNRSSVRTAARWCTPTRNWVKVNADGAVGGQIKMAAAAGVIRDDQGRWSYSALSAELWVIYDSLSLAWNLGFRRIEWETDCAMAVKILKNDRRMEQNGAVTLWIRKLLKRDWEVKVSHVNREANR
ncbi:hypothetical protein F3Y22_tig00111832pilonHSYRG00055 [Hibiscus syriacus]|uniref:RNase H type-1 domain-containing protein n=1 Tax=Hibiscus syriacus TaxID=106335 RepID=A0A6A2XBI0_HIBSY|nr:hypothetical protein F3Y22_tig00111832pilonHSYRG00055 [Hibiscus syriacus]